MDDMSKGQIPSLSSSDLDTITLSSSDSITLDSITLGSTIDDSFDYANLAPITIDLSDISGNLTHPIYSNTAIYSGTSGITLSPSTIPSTVWATNTSATTWTMPSPSMTTNNGITTMSQDVEIKGNLKVGGKDIGSLLEKIEERLTIYHPEPELEEKWCELRELAQRYNELAADIKEKEQIWAILKK